MLKNNSIYIWDQEIKPNIGNVHIAYWQSYSVLFPEKEVSVPQLVEDHDDLLKSSYLALIYELGETRFNNKNLIEYLEIESGFSYWWMSLFNEKCNYSKSLEITNVIKLMAFEGWLLNQEFTSINLISSNKALAKSFELLASKLKIKFYFKFTPPIINQKKIVRRVYDFFPHIAKAPIFLIRHVFDRWELKGHCIDNWRKSEASLSFISYFAYLDINHEIKQQFKSDYWTTLPNLLEKQNLKSNWLHIYVKSNDFPSAVSAKKQIEKYNEEYRGIQNHILLDSFISLKVIYKTFYGWIKLLTKYKKIKLLINNKLQHFAPLFDQDIKKSFLGVTLMQNLLYYYSFISAMGQVKTQNKGIYLQENQGWEFGFVSAWRQFKHKNNLIGVPHSTVRYWDLRYFFDPRLLKQNSVHKIPLPDKVGINGPMAKKAYLKWGYSKGNLVELEALRYLKIKKPLNPDNSTHSRNEPITMLVLGDSLEENSIRQMQLLQKASEKFISQIKYIVKPHPLCPIETKDYPSLDMHIKTKPIDQLIDDCMIAYTSSVTSAALDVFNASKFMISILDPKVLNLSPLRGNSSIRFVSTADEMAHVINNFDKSKNISVQNEDFFYTDLGLPKWKILLNLDEDQNETSRKL